MRILQWGLNQGPRDPEDLLGNQGVRNIQEYRKEEKGFFFFFFFFCFIEGQLLYRILLFSVEKGDLYQI